VILLADDDRKDVVHAAKTCGVSRCLEHRHLATPGCSRGRRGARSPPTIGSACGFDPDG
jgi:hypothetical protein